MFNHLPHFWHEVYYDNWCDIPNVLHFTIINKKCCLKFWNPITFNAKMWNVDRPQVDIPITYIFLISHSQLLIFWNERCNFTIQFSPSCFNILEQKLNTNYIRICFWYLVLVSNVYILFKLFVYLPCFVVNFLQWLQK